MTNDGKNMSVETDPFMNSATGADPCALLAESGTDATRGRLALVFSSVAEVGDEFHEATIVGIEVDSYKGPGNYAIDSTGMYVDGVQYDRTSGEINIGQDGSGKAQIAGSPDDASAVQVTLAYTCHS